MAEKSQFFYFYIDELIKSHWVDWLEGPLSQPPSREQQHLRGFQESLGDTGAGPRTRAGEAYSLGILCGRLVKPQVAGAPFPQGWEAVIKGQVPATRLGYYSYIIGKALRSNTNDLNLVSALNRLAALIILHIAFQHEGRWFSTALVFLFAQKQLENDLSRHLSDIELRYLSAAAINTLDSQNADLLITPYSTNGRIAEMRFDMEDGSVKFFSLEDLPSIVEDGNIGINDFRKTKAALFWSRPERGIYMRAREASGGELLDALLTVDQKRLDAGEDSIISNTLDAIHSNEINHGFLDYVREELGDYPSALNTWIEVENELFAATNKAVEAVNLSSAPSIWTSAQQKIRSAEQSSSSPRGASDAPDTPSEVEEPEVSTAGALTDGRQSQTRKGKVTPTKPDLLDTKSVNDYLDEIDGNVEELPPEPTSKRGNASGSSKSTVSKPDYGEQHSENRKLGEAGESFIFEHEKRRLTRLGRDDLAAMVQWASKDVGDGLGYDIISYTGEGDPLYIEVKTTRGKKGAPFFVSKNEVVVSQQKGKAYKLMRVFNYADGPKFFVLSGSLSDNLQLEATSYRATL